MLHAADRPAISESRGPARGRPLATDDMELPCAVPRISKEMDYVEALRENGWLPDPTDTVVVGVEHAGGCLARAGRECTCLPRLVLRASSVEASSDDGYRHDVVVAWVGAVQAG